jgi:hypothetical protein
MEDLEGGTLRSDAEDPAQRRQSRVCLSGSSDQRQTGSHGVKRGRHGLSATTRRPEGNQAGEHCEEKNPIGAEAWAAAKHNRQTRP